MNIEIIKFVDPGVAKKERILMKAIKKDNVGFYVVFNTTELKPGTVSSKVLNAYWFPNREIKPGDLICLYTKPGKDNEVKKEDGTTTFFFYWGEEKTLWNKAGDSAVLLRIGEWNYKARS